MRNPCMGRLTSCLVKNLEKGKLVMRSESFSCSPGSAKAAGAQPERHTGQVPEVHEAPAHRRTVQQDAKHSDAVWSPWRSGGATTEQTHGEERKRGKLGK